MTTLNDFKNCPICGRKPNVDTYNVNTALVSCCGKLFHRHDELSVFIEYARPSILFDVMKTKWNSLVDEVINEMKEVQDE